MFLMIPDNPVLPLRVSLARIMTRDTELLIISFHKEEGFQLHLKCNRVSPLPGQGAASTVGGPIAKGYL